MAEPRFKTGDKAWVFFKNYPMPVVIEDQSEEEGWWNVIYAERDNLTVCDRYLFPTLEELCDKIINSDREHIERLEMDIARWESIKAGGGRE